MASGSVNPSIWSSHLNGCGHNMNIYMIDENFLVHFFLNFLATSQKHPNASLLANVVGYTIPTTGILSRWHIFMLNVSKIIKNFIPSVFHFFFHSNNNNNGAVCGRGTVHGRASIWSCMGRWLFWAMWYDAPYLGAVWLRSIELL